MLTASATETQPRSAKRWSRLTVVLCSTGFVVVATAAQLFRQSGVEMWRTVWAEDGVRFYADALERPLREIVFEPYAGYGLVVPRILASVGVHLPVSSYSGFVSVSSAAIASSFALFVYFASAPLLYSRLKQGVLAVALLMWPVLPFEVTGTIANLQWVMIVGCLLAVLLPVDRAGSIAVRLAIVVLAPLTSPLCVLFAPIAVWQLVVAVQSGAGRRRLLVPAAFLLAAAGQLLIMLAATQEPRTSPTLGTFAVDAVKLYSTKVTTELVLGSRVTKDLWPTFGYGLAALSLVVVGGLLVWKWVGARWTARWFIVACVGVSGLVYVASLWQRSNFLDSMVVPSAGPYNFLGMRYQLFPAALLLLALLVRRDLSVGTFREPDATPPPMLRDDVREHRIVTAIVVVWLAIAFVPSYRLTTLRSGGPDWIDGVARAEQLCRDQGGDAQLVPISPPPDWIVALPCSELVPGESSAR